MSMSKVHKLSGHKLLYKMNRPAHINVKPDFKKLNLILKEKSSNHLDEIMASTRTQARYIRAKDVAYQTARDKFHEQSDQKLSARKKRTFTRGSVADQEKTLT